MQTVNISDFRSHLVSYLKAAQMGESLSVTSHGQVLAVIMPPNQAKQEAKIALQQIAPHSIIDDVLTPLLVTAEANLQACGLVKTIW